MRQSAAQHARKELVGIIVLSLCIVLQAVGQDHHEASGVSAAAQRLGHRWTILCIPLQVQSTKMLSNQSLYLACNFPLISFFWFPFYLLFPHYYSTSLNAESKSVCIHLKQWSPKRMRIMVVLGIWSAKKKIHNDTPIMQKTKIRIKTYTHGMSWPENASPGMRSLRTPWVVRIRRLCVSQQTLENVRNVLPAHGGGSRPAGIWTATSRWSARLAVSRCVCMRYAWTHTSQTHVCMHRQQIVSSVVWSARLAVSKCVCMHTRIHITCMDKVILYIHTHILA